MRVRAALLCLALLGACGGEDEPLGPGGPGGAGPGDFEGPAACEPCFDRLVAETDPCGPALDACLDDPTLPLEPIVVCFQTEGQCYDSALTRSAACNEGCGDASQAQVELCTGQCFLARASCAERTVRGVDACLDVCSGANCDLCTFNGQAEFDQCNGALEACAEQCKTNFRD